jgi:hypothetical protein
VEGRVIKNDSAINAGFQAIDISTILDCNTGKGLFQDDVKQLRGAGTILRIEPRSDTVEISRRQRRGL